MSGYINNWFVSVQFAGLQLLVLASNLCGYISTDYIFDSIKHNKLQDVEKYKLVT